MINILTIDTKKNNITINDLICIYNLNRKTNVESRVIEATSEYILIEGKYQISKDAYAVAGSKLIKVVNSEQIEGNTKVFYNNSHGVVGNVGKDNFFRTVIVAEDEADIELLSWEFTDSLGSVTSSLFPVELSGGLVAIKSDLKLWSPLSKTQKYKVRNRKTGVYIFKGTDTSRYLKYSTVVTKVKFNTRSKKEPNKIILEIKTKLSQWYDKDVTLNVQLKGTRPHEFFKTIFNLKDNDVYYAKGVDPESFLSICNLHTKEYKTISELLKAYCQNGIRFCFDRLERVKIFGDFKVGSLNTDRVIDYDITDSMLTEDDQLIYNTINTKVYQRQTLYNFEDLDNKYVKFFKKKERIVNSSSMIGVQENGDYTFKDVEINDKEIWESVQLKDLVLLKRTVAPYEEFMCRVIGLETNKVHIVPILYDKDFRLFNYGKDKYLYNLLVVQSCDMDIYYVREELPIIWKLTRKKGNEEKDSSLMIPLLPKVDGEVKHEYKTNAIFGCASNLKVGKYTGIVEEVDPIYGTWDNTDLLYNMEMTQFSNTQYPPIFLLSNQLQERVLEDGGFILDYTTFDNSGIFLQINRPEDTNCDAIIIAQNTKNVNSDIDLYIDKELSRFGNKVLQVEDITPYKLGDVLIVNRPDDLTPQEETEFDEILSTIKWTVTYKETQRSESGVDKHYIYVDSPFAKRQKKGSVYEFTRYPNTSIVYLQELYFLGNPVIEVAQDVVGTSKQVTTEGDTSMELYGEKRYEIDSKQLNKESLKMMMGYILDNFNATSINTTKFVVPISVFNGIDIELLDVVRVNDPYYTQIQDAMKWIVTEISSKSNTNEIQLKLLNINSSDTKPYKIDIKDIIEYKPVEIPKYDHAGGEGNDKPNNDGTGGTDIDKTLGQFWLAEVDPQKFRARVDRFEKNYIYFKDFNGTEVEEYKSKLFPVDEFAVNIKGEVLFVQSDMNYRAFIKKRRVYDTEEVVIAPEDDVTFLVTTTYVDIDGTFFGRKVMLGDGDNYLSVDPIKGVKIVGDFVVGENNKNPNNDLWQSLQNNRTFQQDEKPVDTPAYKIKEGDIWIDTNDENHPYRYNGKVWVSTRDSSIVSSKNSVFIQPDEPKDKDGRPLIDGDTWYDSDDGNKPYIYKNGKWVNVTDMTLQEAINAVEKQAKESLSKLDDMANDSKLTPDEKKQIVLELDQIKVEYTYYVAESEKFGLSNTTYKEKYRTLLSVVEPLIGDLSTTTDINRVAFKGHFVGYYEARQDLINSISSKAKELADKAQADATTALGNAKIFWKPEEPTEGMKENDLWYDTDDQNHPYIYRGAEKGWVSARDKIFETEGGNKVYFQSTQPPSDGYGVKEGDMWFDTAHNNTQYVLMLQDNGQLKWVLASDALDKINTGRIVLNGNTQVNGDFIVRGKNIELTGDTKITGILEVFSNDKGIISYNGTTESNSTQRVLIGGGEILFQEKI